MLTGVEKKRVIKQHKDHMSTSSIIIDGRRVWTFYKDQHCCQEMLVLFVMHGLTGDISLQTTMTS